MGILDKLFGRKSNGAVAAVKTAEEMQAECPHAALMGRWDSVEDMGKDEKVTAFVCDSCHTAFAPEEGRHLRETTATRLHAEEIERARQRAEQGKTADQ